MNLNFLAFLRRPDPMPGSWPNAIPDTMAPATGEENRYRMPYPPPTGRRVSDRRDRVWTITPDGSLIPDGEETGYLPWGVVLALHGPLTLIDLTDEERASEALYGPVSARWGTPGTPCAFPSCALDLGHVGTHCDDQGQPLGVTDKADRMYIDPPRGSMLSRICTCGNIAQHQPGCARYVAPPDDEPATISDFAGPTLLGYAIQADGQCGSTDGDGSWCVLTRGHEGPHDDGLTSEVEVGLFPPDIIAAAAQILELPNGDAFIGTPEERDQAAADLVPRKRAARKATAPPATGGRKRAPRKAAGS